MAQKIIAGYKDFSGGLNTKKSSTMLKENESPNLINCDVDTEAIIQRNGYKRWNNTALAADSVNSLHRYYKENGDKYLLASCGDKLYSVGEYTAASTALKTFTTNEAWISYQTYIDFAYVMSHSDGLYKWDGSTFTGPIAGAPSSLCMVAHAERMWAANTTSYKSYVYWSSAFDPNTWLMSDDYWKVAPDDGDQITALVPMLDNLMVFKENSIWMFTGTHDPDNEMQLIKRVTDVGCVAPRTAVTLNNRIYFLSKNDVREFDGVATRNISANIESEIKSINQTHRQDACAVAYNNKYYLSFTPTGETTNKTVLVYDTIKRSWTKYEGINSNRLITLSGGDDNGELLSASSDDNGFVYQLDTGSSDGWYLDGGTGEIVDGAAISMVYSSPWLDMGIPESKKKLKRAWVYIGADGDYDITFNYAFDLEEPGNDIVINLSGSGALWDYGTYDVSLWGGESIVSDRQFPTGKGRYVRYKFNHSGVNEPIRIYGVSLQYRPKRAK